MKCPFAAAAQARPETAESSTPSVEDEVSRAVLFELSRRGMLQALAIGAGAMALPAMAGCAADESGEDGSTQGAASQTSDSFYKDVDAAIASTPITIAPPSATSTKADIDEFKKQAEARYIAIAGVISAWLQKAYTTTDANGNKVRGLFDELFENRDQKPLFNPGIGPSLVFQHAHVTEILINTEAFTVDPYAPIMQTATSGSFYPAEAGAVPAGHTGVTKLGFYNHYMLGTDTDSLYEVDSNILRKVVNASDVPRLRTVVRDIVDSLIGSVKSGVAFDVIDLCRYTPIRLIGTYLGVPSFTAKDKTGIGLFNVDDLRAGQTFPADADFLKRFNLKAVTEGIVPTQQDLYVWLKAIFRNTFNNVQKDLAVRQEGLQKTELVLLWIARLMAFYRAKLEANGFKIDGKNVPDTMLTRLLVLQHDARDTSKQAALAAELGCASVDELLARTADDRVQANVFGTAVGAVANPEEANGRIIQSLLRFKEKKIVGADSKTSYENLKRLAAKAKPGAPELPATMNDINAYALEFLRVNPQGETLLRKCVKTATVGGVEIKAGTLVFNCHGAAMQDAKVIAEPAKINVSRAQKPLKYSKPADKRANEFPQSDIYLQHGYGRHKCLGRYASEITMQEVLCAVLRKGDIQRAGSEDLKMDANNLYADSFKIIINK